MADHPTRKTMSMFATQADYWKDRAETAERELAKAEERAKALEKRLTAAVQEALRLADELRKRDPSWGSPMHLNDAARGKDAP